MNTKNEVIDTLKKYFQGRCEGIHIFGSDKGVNDFLNFYTKSEIIPYEAPDAYIMNGNDCLITEHFKFDSFKRTKKGSQYEKEISSIRDLKNKKAVTEKIVEYSGVITSESSYSDYVSNIIREFKNHYKKIPNYIDNLKKGNIIDNNTHIKVVFMIDDNTPGSFVVDDEGKKTPIVLSQCEEFLDVLKESQKINYILSFSSVENNCYAWFIDRDEFDEYYENVVDYNSFQFYHPKPLVHGRKFQQNI